VNGEKLGRSSFPNLANWEMWDFITETIHMEAGDNMITYQIDADDKIL
jgi:hypothetical protein